MTQWCLVGGLNMMLEQLEFNLVDGPRKRSVLPFWIMNAVHSHCKVSLTPLSYTLPLRQVAIEEQQPLRHLFQHLLGNQIKSWSNPGPRETWQLRHFRKTVSYVQLHISTSFQLRFSAIPVFRVDSPTVVRISANRIIKIYIWHKSIPAIATLCFILIFLTPFLRNVFRPSGLSSGESQTLSFIF
jgi:hypothetical protein